MYPTITYFLKDVFGWNVPLPIQTYGFFVATAFLVAGYVLMLELKRKEKLGWIVPFTKKEKKGEPATSGELAISGIVGFILGYKLIHAIFNYTAFVDNPQELLLSTEGNWAGGIIIGILSALWTWWDKHKDKLEKPVTVDKTVHPYETAGNLLLVAALFGLLGTKIFHNLEHIDELIKNPIHAIFSFSGLSFYGGLIVGGGALVYFAKKNNIKPLHLLDSGAPAVCIGYSIGRTGCHTSGDGCWGLPNPNPKPDWMSFLPDWMWAFHFPHNVINDGIPIENCANKYCRMLETPVYPTSFYELTIMAIVFIVLWSFRKKIKLPGVMFAIFLMCNGIERFFIEKIRVNPPYHIFGLEVTQAELISTILFLSGFIGIFLLMKHKERILATHTGLSNTTTDSETNTDTSEETSTS